MDTEQKAVFYRAAFNSPLSEMMIGQMGSANVDSRSQRWYLVQMFGKYRDTKEGIGFWTEIAELYKKGELPTEYEIKDVFKKHHIEYYTSL